MNFIVSLIKLSQPMNILEIGTAIGYSALSMHYGLPNAHITTLERNEDMFNEATKNFEKYSLNDKIDLIKGDALETLQIGRAQSELQSRGHLVCRLLLEK